MSRGNILFGVSGSIAAFKSAALISKLVKEGFTVQVAATANALKFVGEATFEGLTGRPVFSNVFSHGQMMDHIHLARWADLFIIAPASAATLNRLAYGIAEDAVANLYLAIEPEKPVFVAPAMNTMMYSHPATQESLARLRSFGATVIEPGAGALACGESGQGRMAEPDQLFAEIVNALETRTSTASVPPSSLRLATHGRVLVTSGGTREYIDGVRSLTNFSTGQTGATVAEALRDAGYDVTFVQAKSSARAEGVNTLTFDTYEDLENVLKKTLSEISFDAVLHLAAVSDFSVDKIGIDADAIKPSREIKIGSDKSITLHLKRNPKLITRLKSWSKNKDIKVVAYKLTNTTNILERSEAISKLLEDANIDYVVHNDFAEITPVSHPFRVYGDTGFTRTGNTKNEMAQALIEIVKPGVSP